MKLHKKLLSFILIFVFLVSTITIAEGTTTGEGGTVEGDYEGDQGDTNFGEGGKNNSYPDPSVSGIRVSFVRADGTNLASHDYVFDDHYDSVTTGTYQNNYKKVKIATKKCNKAALVSGKCILTWDSGKEMSKVSASKLSEFQKYFTVTNDKGETYTFPVNLDSPVKSKNYSGIFDGLFESNNSSLSHEKYNEYITILFNNMLKDYGIGSIADYKVSGEKAGLYDLFMVFEPITVLTIQNEMYFGTFYELAQIAVNSKGGDYKGCTNAACDLTSIVLRQLPCASYLNGSLYDDLKEAGSTILIKSFSNNSYFNNSIKIIYDNAKNTCLRAGDSFKDEQITGDYGIGMGVVWLSVYLPDQENYTCNEIKEIVNWEGSLSKTFDRLYKNGGVQAIYNNYKKTSYYPNGYFTFRDDNNELIEVDLKWFVNECTCYGMYDYYNNTVLEQYLNDSETQFLLNELSKTFGSSNWYQPPSLFESKSWVINSKITANKFFQYNNENKIYAESRGLTWTPVSSEKYHDVLKCGVNETYWCDEFDNFYEQMRKNNSTLSSYPTISTIKDSSPDVIIENYKDQLETVMQAYNLKYFPATGFMWTVNDQGDNNYSYIKNCIGDNKASCEMIKSFYSSNNLNLDAMSCEKLRNFNFSAYNKTYGTSIDGNWYVTNCGCSTVNSYNCTPLYDLGTCLTGDELLYKDSSNGIVSNEYWEKCVFNDYGKYETNVHKFSNKNSSLSYFEKNLGSEYCEVYCIEDVMASFSSSNINVEAGRRFNFGYSYISGSRTCKTKSVDWDKFEEDIDKVNEDIEKKYDEWQEEIEHGGSASSINLKKKAYEEAKKEASNIVDNMKKCYTWDSNDIYNTNPKASIVYSEPVNYSYSDELSKTTTYGNVVDSSNCKDEKIDIINCDSGICKTEKTTLEKCDYVMKTRSAKTTFTLKPGVYRYVLKSNHLSFHANQLGNYINGPFTNNYIDLGFSNLPVSYSTPDGLYGIMHDKGQLDINYSNIGHVSNGSKTIVDNILSASSTNTSKYGKWECEFNVFSGLFPEDPDTPGGKPGGDPDKNPNNKSDINLIYRPIDLSRPFPDIDASDRETGSNWCTKNGDCSTNNAIVRKYIINNRNVNGFELYNEEPMYTFILTPAIVNEIRKYNDENSYTSYTGTLNGQSFDYKCQEKTGKACISDYLTHIINITKAKEQPGVCVDDKFRSYNDPDNFESCRY